MRKNIVVFIGCLLICASAYRWGGTGLETAKTLAVRQLYIEVTEVMFPMIYLYDMSGTALVYRDMEEMLTPIFAEVESGVVGQDKDKTKKENQVVQNLPPETEAPDSSQSEESSEVASTETLTIQGSKKQVEINRVKLQDFDYLLQNFYQVDSSTTVGKDVLDVEELLSADLTLKEAVEGPQVLIYHTHSQEGYSDSIEGDASTSVVAVGDYLTELLEEKYGIRVLHHKGEYDLPNRDSAYSTALPALQKILEENPSIEVVIDLHRDGVSENVHLVTDVNGKQTAQIMFFNGLSRTTAQGELAYLENPYIEDNLAFSFQMQLAAEEYYPGFARKIYLKGYRYNLHLCPKSILVEVGAQTNSFQEAKNAMEPLAEILAMVLLDE